MREGTLAVLDFQKHHDSDCGTRWRAASNKSSTLGLCAATSLGVVHPEPFGRGPVPYPTTLVLDADGRVAWVRVGENVADRADPDAILAAVRAVSP